MPSRLSQGKGIIKKTIKINNIKVRQSLSPRPYNTVSLRTQIWVKHLTTSKGTTLLLLVSLIQFYLISKCFSSRIKTNTYCRHKGHIKSSQLYNCFTKQSISNLLIISNSIILLVSTRISNSIIERDSSII
jgi:hypothetical protein